MQLSRPVQRRQPVPQLPKALSQTLFLILCPLRHV